MSLLHVGQYVGYGNADDGVEFENNAQYMFVGDMTFSTWMRPSRRIEAGSASMYVLSKGASSEVTISISQCDDNSVNAAFTHGQSGATTNPSFTCAIGCGTLFFNRWAHISVTREVTGALLRGTSTATLDLLAPSSLNFVATQNKLKLGNTPTTTGTARLRVQRILV